MVQEAMVKMDSSWVNSSWLSECREKKCMYVDSLKRKRVPASDRTAKIKNIVLRGRIKPVGGMDKRMDPCLL
jgi:hypothetical protein